MVKLNLVQNTHMDVSKRLNKNVLDQLTKTHGEHLLNLVYPPKNVWTPVQMKEIGRYLGCNLSPENIVVFMPDTTAIMASMLACLNSKDTHYEGFVYCLYKSSKDFIQHISDSQFRVEGEFALLKVCHNGDLEEI